MIEVLRKKMSKNENQGEIENRNCREKRKERERAPERGGRIDGGMSETTELIQKEID